MRRVIYSTRWPRGDGTVFLSTPAAIFFKAVGIVSVLLEPLLVHSMVTYFSVAIVLESLIPALDAEDLRSQPCMESRGEFHSDFEPS